MENNEPEIVENSEEEINELPYDPDAEEDWDAVAWGEDDGDEDTGKEESEEGSDGDDDEADQPEADKAEKQAETETADSEEADDTDQWIELKHLDDEPRKVSKDEAKVLAQKGLDYDRIRQERDSLKASLPKYEEMEKFLKEMQGDFASIDEFMDDTRARLKADAEGISYADALAQVKAAKTPAPAQKSSQDDIHVDEFVRRFPDVKAEDIPASVWAEVRNTGNLAEAYEKYDNSKKNDRIAELEREIETLKKNKKNSDRSTGSSKSSGATSHKSLIASMWDEED